jgi:hypothetical protein
MIGLGKALEVGLGIVDKLIPDPEERAKARLKLLQLEQEGQFKELDAAMNVIVAEAKSEHPLTAQWRPITMLVFVGLIAAHWFGFTAPNLSEDQVLSLLDIVKLGLGGYVIGRSAEKVAKQMKEKS